MSIFKQNKPSQRPVMGEPGWERWDNEPENKKANNGMGLCQTNFERGTVCSLGGIGCNVDHAWIAFHRDK